MSQPPIDPRTGLPRRSANPWVVVLIVVGACGGIGLAGIAIFAAIMFPVFANAREAARKASCMSNAKIMSTALLMYAQDYDFRLPPARSWQTELAPYNAEGANTCPSRAGVSPAYAFNREMSGKPLAMLKTPYDAPVIFESGLGTNNASDQLLSFVTPHRQTGIIGFADGSVRALKTPPNGPGPRTGE